MRHRKGAALLLCGLLCLSLCGCNTVLQILGRGDAIRAEEEPTVLKAPYEEYGECKSFSYSYGDFNNGYLSFDVFPQGDKLYFKAEGNNGIDLNVMAPVEPEVLLELDEIIKRHRIYAWNGFYAGKSDVLDGESFTLTVEYANATLAASGYADKPDNYSAGHEALAGYLEPMAEGLPPKALDAGDDVIEVSLYLKDEAVELNFFFEEARAEYHHEVQVDYDLSEVDQGRLWQLKYDAVDAYNRNRDKSVTDEEALPFLSVRYRMGEMEGTAELKGTRAQYGDDYDELRTQALALVGLSQNFTEGEAYQNEVYRGQFRSFHKVMLYDIGRRGYDEIIIDLPEQSLLISGRRYTASAEAMETFYAALQELQAESFLDQGFYYDSNVVHEEYTEGSEQDVRQYRNYEREDVRWLYGESTGWQLKMYGGQEYPHDWEALTAIVDELVRSARRVGYVRPASEEAPAP